MSSRRLASRPIASRSSLRAVLNVTGDERWSSWGISCGVTFVFRSTWTRVARPTSLSRGQGRTPGDASLDELVSQHAARAVHLHSGAHQFRASSFHIRRGRACTGLACSSSRSSCHRHRHHPPPPPLAHRGPPSSARTRCRRMPAGIARIGNSGVVRMPAVFPDPDRKQLLPCPSTVRTLKLKRSAGDRRD